MCMCLCRTEWRGKCLRGQKRASYPMELELQTVVGQKLNSDLLRKQWALLTIETSLQPRYFDFTIIDAGIKCITDARES